MLYLGSDLATSGCEVFGEAGEARLCPSWRVALLRPARPTKLFDLTAEGAAMAIGALPTLATGNLPRAGTQAWARSIHEDNPTGTPVAGIRYTSSAYNGGAALALWERAAPLRLVVGSTVNYPKPLPAGSSLSSETAAASAAPSG